MNNHERAESLLSRAKRIMSTDLEAAMEQKDFNMVVRRAQESVELSLKGALLELGIEYPKVHDVGRVFSDAVRKKHLDLSDATLARISGISAKLSANRAPAFYGDRLYQQGEAEEARREALFVVEEVSKILERGSKDTV